jgi:hypothetical protein
MHLINVVTTGTDAKIIDPDKHYIPAIFSKPREEEREFNLDEKILMMKKA